VSRVGVPQEHWVFGYGSLMWRPGFAHVERRKATLHGRRRAFCIYSVHHRGRPERPGLVLGLTTGGSVAGVAFLVEPSRWEETRAYLTDREQPTETYIEAARAVRLDDGRMVEALVFLSDTSHPGWAGDLELDCQAALIARSAGVSGLNIDYLRDLVAHLRAQGTRDPGMELLLQKAEALHVDAPVRSAA
jgi:glutathione-specific gamma-glutamylcyclotransferase